MGSARWNVGLRKNRGCAPGLPRVTRYALDMTAVTKRAMVLPASAAVVFALAAAAPPQAPDPDARAAQVEAKMTDEERFELLHGVMPLPLPGKVAPPAGVKPSAGYIKGVPRLGIPDLRETDGGLGITNPFQSRPGGATALPSSQLLAATWNPALALEAGRIVGLEAKALGFNVLLGGGVNLARNPRNGRNFEYLGEDPLLAGTMAGETIRGTQSVGVIATVKHFAFNNDETLRRSVDVRITPQAAHESDLLAFQIAIERGAPGSVMCSYNLVNGAKACGNDWLLNQVLKTGWGYKGWVMSDWGAVDAVDYAAAGLDQQSGSQLDAKVWFDAPLKAELAAGRILRPRISDAVRKILRSIYAVGADAPGVTAAIDTGAHATIARRIAQDGIVLLKNAGVLPIARTAKSILIVGGHADIGVLSGGGSSQVVPDNGAPIVLPVGDTGDAAMFARQLYMPSSPLAALKAALPGATIDYDSGYVPAAAAARAARADMVIVFATQWQSEGYDAGDMTLPEGQDGLIARVLAANPNSVVVLETGNPVEMPWADKAKAIVAAWYPGEEGGGAIADVLTGAVDPSGRLPQSWPVAARQMPRATPTGFGLPLGSPITLDYDEGADVGYRWFARTGSKPRYAFGHGLSYTRFAMGPLTIATSPAVIATVTVRNVGARDGATVAQIYLLDAAGAKRMRLAGFAKIALKAGESRSVQVPIDRRLLADWTPTGWVMPAGRYTLAVGEASDALGKPTIVTLPADRFGR